MKWYLLLVVLLILPLASANTESLELVINEQGKITNYLNTYWVVNVQGEGTLTNPSNSDLFDVRLFFDVVGLPVLEGPGDGTFDGTSLYFRRVPRGDSVTFSYEIIGIAVQPPTLQNRGVLYSGFAKREPRIYSDVFGRLQKAPMEESSITGRDARLISVTFDNPSNLQYTIEELRVIKTPQLDPNQELNRWEIVNPSDPRTLPGGGFFVEDFLDDDAEEGEVYWLQSDVYISNVDLIDQSNLTRVTEQNLTVPVESLNFTNVSSNETLDTITPRYALRKSVSNTFVVPGEPVRVTLRLYNFEPSLVRYDISDSLPAGFSSEQDLSWQGEIPAREAVEITYDAVLERSVLAGLDSFPAAQGTIAGVSVRSQPVSFVRRFSADNQLYVQKSIEHIDDSFSRVTISIRNLGSNVVRDVTVRERLGEGAEFSQITQQPQSRGVWVVDEVSPGGSWEVSYVTQSGDWVQNLPSIFGVPAESVLRTLLLENVVREGWSFVRTRGIEVFGITVLVLVPALLFLGRRYGWFAS